MRRNRNFGLAIVFPLTLVLIGVVNMARAAGQEEASVDEFMDMSLNDLLQLEVSSVSRRAQQLREAAAAVHVITAEDIRRSGVTNIPDALRMVPGISVGRINTSNWAVTSRGFNGSFSNKLLVLMDGRTLYTPVFSGVYWDAQDTMLENIERIEVIRGPGATLWGANAVNGIINIITKSAADTQGGLLVARAGTEDRAGMALRYGDTLGDDRYLRAYLNLRRNDEQVSPVGVGSNDDWNAGQGGFRFDGFLDNGDELGIRGDFYRSEGDQQVVMPAFIRTVVTDQARAEGFNLGTSWRRELNNGSEVELSVYYDRNHRREVSIGQKYTTLDVDFQHDLADWGKHNIIWGAGYRRTDDQFHNTATLSFNPPSESFDLFSGFIQDEITLTPQTRLTVGAKIEHNDYTGVELQPNARLAWIPGDQHMFWGAISRAVRTPSRVEQDSNLSVGFVPVPIPVPITLLGSTATEAEELIAYEAGYRYTVEDLSIDIAVFFNDYDRLMGQDYSTQPLLRFANDLEGQTYGFELAADWRARDWWRWQLAYTFEELEFDTSAAVPDRRTLAANAGSVPEQQISLRSSMDLSEDLQLDIWGRYVGRVKYANSTNMTPIPSYATLDVRLGWQVSKDLEMSLVGQNLLEPSRLEFVQESFIPPTEIQRAVYGQLKFKF